MPVKPKPNILKKIEGTFRSDRATNERQSVSFSVPNCPEWLSDGAKAEWAYVMGELKRCRNISKRDRGALALLCTLYARIAEASFEGKELSPGLIGHYIKLVTQFGLTPGSRGAVSVEPSNSPEENKWAAFQRKEIVGHE
jgi:phage terminase small subunit